MASNQLIFISGGVRSGKSSFAELYAAQVAKSKQLDLYYLATSINFDKEMDTRIAHHKKTRDLSTNDWKTIEAPSNISRAIKRSHEGSVILLDCLTVWLSNEFYEQQVTEDIIVNSEKWCEVREDIMNQIKEILRCVDTLIIVSNDVFHDTINETIYVKLYSRMLGELHQLIVKEANQAFAVESSIPILMKQN